MIEIERKFLVVCLPNLDNCLFKELKQAYLSFEPEVRIRSLNDKDFYLAQKGDGDLLRGEVEENINNIHFQILTNLIQGRVISKTRYYISINDSLVAELDIYHGDFEGLVTVETEFNSEEAANNFEKPSWYGAEITYDKSYKNKNLARMNEEDILKLRENLNRSLKK